MGHHDVVGTVFGYDDLDAAYNYLYETDEWDGDWKRHSGGVMTDSRFRTPILSDDREAMIAAEEALSNRTESYSYALAAPLIKVEPARYEHVREAHITMDFVTADLDEKDYYAGLSEAGKKKVAKALGVKYAEVGDIRMDYASGVKRKYTLKYKAETGEGKAETRYFVIPENESGNMPAWEKGFATQAAARASVHGTKEFETGTNRYIGSKFEIVGMIRRQDGGALVKSKSHVTKATLPLRVDIRRKVSERRVTNERGWLIVGSVHT